MTETNTPILEAREVCRQYPDGRVNALIGVSAAIADGEYVAIMGPSGSGKSTLLNLLGGLDRPTAGRVYFRGERLPTGWALDRFRARHVGFVFQSFFLLPTLTVLENVQVPMFEGELPARQRRERALHLLEQVGMCHRLKHLPSKLSVGERQRVAIARALANDPQIVLADEPTGNLDSERANEVLELFDELRTELTKTLVVVTHSREVASRADRVIELRDGRLVAQPTQLRALAVAA